MPEQELYILKQKLNNLIKGEMQKFDDALSSSDSKDAAKSFSYPTNTREKADMSCERINNLSKDVIYILQELANKGILVINPINKQIVQDTVRTELINEAERLKILLSHVGIGFIHNSNSRNGNICMIDEALKQSIIMIDTEIDVIINTIYEPSPTITHNTVNANTITAPIQQGGAYSNMTQSISYDNPENLDALRRLVEVFENHIDELKLDASAKRTTMAQVATIKAQLEDEPDPVIVKQAGRTLRSITEGAIGSLIATAAQPAVWAWAASIIPKLFGGP